MKTLFINIKELLQIRDASVSFVSGKEMRELPAIQNAFLKVENGIITDFGSMDSLKDPQADKVIDATGSILMPTWCDSHTHLVYAGNREGEFADRIKGLSYEEIAAKGGGILNSAKKLQETSEEALFEQSKHRVAEIIALGTGAVEIKSGYGLSKEAELKMLRVIKRLQDHYPILIKATFLGAHALPESYKSDKAGYLNMLIDSVLPVIQKEQLASFVDIFCEKGYFDVQDTDKLLRAAVKRGLIPKVHVNQFHAIGGVEVAVNHQALSVDHLEVLPDSDIEILKGSRTMPVALPACSFFLSIPYTPARKIIDAGLPLALASDYNPGSTPSGNMNFVVATACIKMQMTPEEAINAATINAAYAMGVSQELGSISIGKKANLILTKPISSRAFIPYSFGNPVIKQVYINGEAWEVG